MSRIGKRIIEIPAGTEVNVAGNNVTVKGKLGELSREFTGDVAVKVEDGKVSFELLNESNKAMWGTVASHVGNMIDGVNEKYQKVLQVEGVGFRAEVKGSNLVMQLGFSHPVEMEIPSDLEVSVEKSEITIAGINKESVGLFASKVRLKKKPEPYKGKGIRYKGEYIRRKEGKKGV